MLRFFIHCNKACSNVYFAETTYGDTPVRCTPRQTIMFILRLVLWKLTNLRLDKYDCTTALIRSGAGGVKYW
jgi:hypothetical protein